MINLSEWSGCKLWSGKGCGGLRWTKILKRKVKYVMSARATGSPESAPLQNWPRPAKPSSRLYLDFEGPYLGHCWLEVCVINKTTAGQTILLLQQIFSTYGIGTLLFRTKEPLSQAANSINSWKIMKLEISVVLRITQLQMVKQKEQYRCSMKA
ncbi:polyprotein [Plakobranchus ocellatus]|uniref:Polyprotein n=1 Tax=Plakobranchus ocellatus TaxID=259542 RepID=A0AAV3ZNF3_9GAST|nr:polyprotein [Plakobranchus ocellatus]